MPSRPAAPTTLVAVQFRVGAGLLARIDRAAQLAGVSRNRWLRNAVQDLAYLDHPAPARTTASDILARKRTLMIRMEPFLVEVVDEQCQDQRVARTIWLLDACLTKLANGVAHRA